MQTLGAVQLRLLAVRVQNTARAYGGLVQGRGHVDCLAACWPSASVAGFCGNGRFTMPLSFKYIVFVLRKCSVQVRGSEPDHRSRVRFFVPYVCAFLYRTYARAVLAFRHTYRACALANRASSMRMFCFVTTIAALI